MRYRSMVGGGLAMAAAALLISIAAALVHAADDDSPRAVTDMAGLMRDIIQPASDAVFYVSRNPPAGDPAWQSLERQTLMLAESANLLLIPGYARDDVRWADDALVMRDVSVRAWQAARQRDLDALVALNNDLYLTCENCHEVTR